MQEQAQRAPRAEGDAEDGTRPASSGLEEKRFAGGTYARFAHRGSAEGLLVTYCYLWGVWFPRSGLEPADHDDFERCTERFRGLLDPGSESEICFSAR